MMDRSQIPVSNTRIEVRLQRALSLARFASLKLSTTQDTFVFRPGAVPPPNSNIYSSWSALVLAAAKVSGPRWVEFDASFAPCVIPAGAWSFGAWDVEFRGLPGATGADVALSIAAGATLVGVTTFTQLAVTYAGLVPCIAPPAALLVSFYFREQASIVCTAAGSFIRAGAAVTAEVFLEEASLVLTGSVAFDAVGAGALMTMSLQDSASVAANTLAQSAGGVFLAVLNSSAASFGAQAGIPGFAPTINPLASRETYVDSAPLLGAVTVQGAIDALKISQFGSRLVVDPTAVAGGNVFTSLAAAAAAAATVSGPKVVEFRGNVVVPQGVYDFRGPSGLDWSTTFVTAQGISTLTFSAGTGTGSTLLGVRFLENITVVQQGSATLITPPAGVSIFIFHNGNFSSTGGGLVLGGITGTTTVLHLTGSAGSTGGAPVFGTTSAAFFGFSLYDSAALGSTTLTQFAGSTGTVTSNSPANNISLTQPGMLAGALIVGTNLTIGSQANNVTFSGTKSVGTALTALTTVAGADASSVVPPVPANQTTPAANTGVLACILTPVSSGRFLVTGTLQFTGVAANAVTVKLRSQSKAAAIVTGNATPTGLNSFFATANGPITYGGGTTAATLTSEPYTVLAGSLTVNIDFTAIVIPNANNAIAVGSNVAFEITVESAANVTGITGTIGAVELP